MPNSDTRVERIECPEYSCPHIWDTEEELHAHLRWDHNRSEYQADQIVAEVLEQ